MKRTIFQFFEAVLRGASSCALFAWATWRFTSIFIVSTVVMFLTLVYFGSRFRDENVKFPNQLITNFTDEGMARMKLHSQSADLRLHPFIGVAFSGGGSRAANFSFVVLEELERIGLLEHVEAFSSVSGGSITAAWVAQNLNGKPDKKFWEEGSRLLGRDIAADFRNRFFSPDIFIRTFFTSYDRGDVLAETFDQQLFHGASFSNIKSSSIGYGTAKYQPSLFINATALSDPLFSSGMHPDLRLPMGMYMSTFTFSVERFAEMNSNLQAMPISYAVAASAAFPAAINPITLQFADKKVDSTGTQLISKRYIHLADGGLSDNLGTDTLRKVFETRLHGLRAMDAKGKTEMLNRPCLIISIDATSPPMIQPRESSLNPDGRATWWSSIVDATAVHGYDAYLLRRRADQLDELGIDSASVEYSRYYKTRPSSIAHVELRTRYSRFQESHGYAASPTVFTRSQTIEQMPGLIQNDRKSYGCTIWHIALEDLDVYRKPTNGDWRRTEEGDMIAKEIKERNEILRKISATALSLKTDFKLQSVISPNCNVEQLQAVLKRGAQELVHDKQSKPKLCSWLKKAKLPSDLCEQEFTEKQNLPENCLQKYEDKEVKYLSNERRLAH